MPDKQSNPNRSKFQRLMDDVMIGVIYVLIITVLASCGLWLVATIVSSAPGA